MTCVLSFRGVKKAYLDKVVLSNFNLTVEEGEVVRLEGPNGSGKTTILKLACGIERPDDGVVEVMGSPPWKPEAKRLIGAVMHFNMTYPDLTVEENITFFSKLYGAEPEKGFELAREVGLDKRLGQLARELSFGWRKRLELVRALLHSPKLLLLDEPFVGLDEKGKEDMLRLLRKAVEEGVALVYTAPSGVRERVIDGEKVVRLSDTGL